MADRPILFSGPMVRALLAGTKTQTRRILKPQPSAYTGNPIPPEGRSWTSKVRDEPYFAMHDDQIHWCWWDEYNRQGPDWIKLRIAKGDRLWVREAFKPIPASRPGGYFVEGSPFFGREFFYRADGNCPLWADGKWKPSLHMPRAASRLTLAVTDVRVERLQQCSEEDAIAEGIEPVDPAVPSFGWRCYLPEPKCQDGWADPRESYRTLWNSINGPGSWEANPWIYAASFTVQRGNIDAQV